MHDHVSEAEQPSSCSHDKDIIVGTATLGRLVQKLCEQEVTTGEESEAPTVRPASRFSISKCRKGRVRSRGGVPPQQSKPPKRCCHASFSRAVVCCHGGWEETTKTVKTTLHRDTNPSSQHSDDIAPRVLSGVGAEHQMLILAQSLRVANLQSKREGLPVSKLGRHSAIFRERVDPFAGDQVRQTTATTTATTTTKHEHWFSVILFAGRC